MIAKAGNVFVLVMAMHDIVHHPCARDKACLH